jgi:hypothetical protein
LEDCCTPLPRNAWAPAMRCSRRHHHHSSSSLRKRCILPFKLRWLGTHGICKNCPKRLCSANAPVPLVTNLWIPAFRSHPCPLGGRMPLRSIPSTRMVKRDGVPSWYRFLRLRGAPFACWSRKPPRACSASTATNFYSVGLKLWRYRVSGAQKGAARHMARCSCVWALIPHCMRRASFS